MSVTQKLPCSWECSKWILLFDYSLSHKRYSQPGNGAVHQHETYTFHTIIAIITAIFIIVIVVVICPTIDKSIFYNDPSQSSNSYRSTKMPINIKLYCLIICITSSLKFKKVGFWIFEYYLNSLLQILSLGLWRNDAIIAASFHPIIVS